MKSKMRITGNRTVIGIICIVLALGITFGIAPLVNRFTDRKVEVVQVKQNVERGHLITEDDVELVKVGALNLSDRTVKNRKYVVGKYHKLALSCIPLCKGSKRQHPGRIFTYRLVDLMEYRFCSII